MSGGLRHRCLSVWHSSRQSLKYDLRVSLFRTASARYEHVDARSTRLRSVARHQSKHFSSQTRYSSETKSDNDTAETSKPATANSHKRGHSRSILITGGTSGIGFAIAKGAILQGASHIRIITRDADRGLAAIERLRKETSTDIDIDHTVAETDEYTDPKLVSLAICLPNSEIKRAIVSQLTYPPPRQFQRTSSGTTTPPITTIIHSAGITQTSLLTSTPSDAIRKILAVNLESAALLSKAHLKRYMQTCMTLARHDQTQRDQTQSPRSPPSWQIINIASLLALKGGLGTSIYAASKAGLIALTRATSLEGAEVTKRYPGPHIPGFRANVVVPGYIDTPMTGGISGSSRKKLLQDIPTGRFGTPEEVADAVMFLLGNEYANNCVLNLDGGLSAV